MKSLNKLVGKWKISGDAEGQIEYKWLEGSRFLAQDVNITYDGREIRGVEIIGHLQKVGEEKSPEI